MKIKLVALLALPLLSFTAPHRAIAADDGQYAFKVHNSTKDKITKLLASEDGKKYASSKSAMVSRRATPSP